MQTTCSRIRNASYISLIASEQCWGMLAVTMWELHNDTCIKREVHVTTMLLFRSACLARQSIVTVVVAAIWPIPLGNGVCNVGGSIDRFNRAS
jgi:hypothetical protein